MTQRFLTITESAAQRVKTLLEGRGKPSYGIRIGLRSKGCNGLSYTLEFADEAGPYDEVIEVHEVKILIDPKAVIPGLLRFARNDAYFCHCERPKDPRQSSFYPLKGPSKACSHK